MKVALINPPVSGIFGMLQRSAYPPLGLGYLAAYLRRAGHEVRIYSPMPYRPATERMFGELELFKPDLVGLTAVTHSFMVARRLAARAKERLKCMVIMGGPHATALPESTLRSVPQLDAVIRGEGEIPLLAIASRFDAAGKVDFAAIPAASFLAEGAYGETPRPEPIADLDALPYPVRELSGAGGGGPRETHLAVFTSRGCPSRCTFCANICMGRKFRPRSPESVVAELVHLREKYGARDFVFADDCFTADPRRAAEICDLIIAKKLKITWYANGRVNALRDGALVAKLKKAGCTQLLLGIESGDQRVLDLMTKGATLAMAEECCATLRRHGVAYFNSYILASEGDTLKSVLATISFSKKLKSVVAVLGRLVPMPGTPVFEKYYSDFDRPDTDWDAWCSFLPVQPCENRHTELSQRAVFLLTIWANLRFYCDPVQFLRLAAYAVDL